MGSFNIEMLGLEGVKEMLDKQGKLEEKIPTALRKGANVVCKVAVSKAPVRTGTLKSSIRVGKHKRSGPYVIEVGLFYPDIANAYAHMVEFGHGGPKPALEHPFMEPAAEEAGDIAYSVILKELMRG